MPHPSLVCPNNWISYSIPPLLPGGSFAGHYVEPMFISHGMSWKADKASERRELSAASPLAARHPLQEKKLSAVTWRTLRH